MRYRLLGISGLEVVLTEAPDMIQAESVSLGRKASAPSTNL